MSATDHPQHHPDPETDFLGNLACLIEGVRSGIETYAADYADCAPPDISDEEHDEIYQEAQLALMRGLGEYLLAATSVGDLTFEAAISRLGIASKIEVA